MMEILSVGNDRGKKSLLLQELESDTALYLREMKL
jgi:hypothetical protein